MAPSFADPCSAQLRAAELWLTDATDTAPRRNFEERRDYDENDVEMIDVASGPMCGVCEPPDVRRANHLICAG